MDEKNPPEYIRSAFAPGRVNLIGDHTDYNEGVALPIAIDLGTTVTLQPSTLTRKTSLRSRSRSNPTHNEQVILYSDQEDEPAAVDIGIKEGDPTIKGMHPLWARYVAGVITQVMPEYGYTGTVSSSLPIGAGLSSSAALEVSLALALGFQGSPVDLALACQRAESIATGVPCGVMDQLTSIAGIAGSALLIDFSTYEISPVKVPENTQILIVHSGESRALANSDYALRRLQCDTARAALGPLPQLALDQLEDAETFQLLSKESRRAVSLLGKIPGGFPGSSPVNTSSMSIERISDLLSPTVLVKRIRHVVTECQRVYTFSSLLRSGELQEAGEVMYESHLSLARDFEVSTQRLDNLVEALMGVQGIYGARLTGAGFGGCVVALCDGQPPQIDSMNLRHWWVHPGSGAHVLSE
ncbi:MAG: hypothetical protein M1519_05965 [Actinobacteria bacterium]|nr:hypothetical protein [Actinomycetota bacterium]